MNEAHSPLPWSVDNGGVFKDANGDYVGGILFDESADEKFFVRAVNTHAALAEALKEMRDVHARGCRCDTCRKAFNALRQAEEGK